MLYECVQSMYCGVLFNGEECIFTMPPNLIVYYLTLQLSICCNTYLLSLLGLKLINSLGNNINLSSKHKIYCFFIYLSVYT